MKKNGVSVEIAEKTVSTIRPVFIIKSQKSSRKFFVYFLDH